ncbi:hypothetical protein LCGC14_3046520 [marine sediment metagenome]|uniref:Uncharacterized protein n=1 Tax=marine sediment metagenome TaxID=412755 RepID=A0A0F8ZDW7_9ZZZZ
MEEIKKLDPLLDDGAGISEELTLHGRKLLIREPPLELRMAWMRVAATAVKEKGEDIENIKLEDIGELTKTIEGSMAVMVDMVIACTYDAETFEPLYSLDQKSKLLDSHNPSGLQQIAAICLGLMSQVEKDESEKSEAPAIIGSSTGSQDESAAPSGS